MPVVQRVTSGMFSHAQSGPSESLSSSAAVSLKILLATVPQKESKRVDGERAGVAFSRESQSGM
jgi:hypothetical protein